MIVWLVSLVILFLFKLLICFFVFRIDVVFIENLFKFKLSNNGIVVLFLVILLYIFVYLFFLCDVLIICLIKCKIEGLYGWYRYDICFDI